ncbi:MAG: Gfo/Idh/MocA family oxidoreductase, partial [bacterium]
KKIRELFAAGTLGELHYIDGIRINLGLFQRDINVIWDLAPHDISIVQYILQREPKSILAVGNSHTASGLEDVAYIHIDYGNNLLANFSMSWLSPVKTRRMIFSGSKKMIVYDDLDQTNIIKIFDKGIELRKEEKDELYSLVSGYRSGDMVAPAIKSTEALSIEAEHFVECIQSKKEPITNGYMGLKVVQLLEASNQSIKQNRTIIF